MTNLKTLKDLDSNQTDSYKNIDELSIFKERLKQEAIKWANNIYNEAFEHSYYSRESATEMIDWIKHFFNLTEEELKETKK